jgi:hypothetical protein
VQEMRQLGTKAGHGACEPRIAQSGGVSGEDVLASSGLCLIWFAAAAAGRAIYSRCEHDGKDETE